jgi:hypothetical protein
MAKEVSNNEHNQKVFAEIKKHQDKIDALKETLKPAELPKQADLNTCNQLARKAKTKPIKVNPKLVAEESGKK